MALDVTPRAPARPARRPARRGRRRLPGPSADRRPRRPGAAGPTQRHRADPRFTRRGRPGPAAQRPPRRRIRREGLEARSHRGLAGRRPALRRRDQRHVRRRRHDDGDDAHRGRCASRCRATSCSWPTCTTTPTASGRSTRWRPRTTGRSTASTASRPSSGILTTHGGCVKFQVDFAGKVAHVSRSEEGRDALSAAVDVYQALRSTRWTHEPRRRPVAAPAFRRRRDRRPATRRARSPTAATLQGDIRTVPAQSWQTVRADIERVVARGLRRRTSIDACAASCASDASSGPRAACCSTRSRRPRDVYGSDPAVNAEKAAQSFVTDAVDMH